MDSTHSPTGLSAGWIDWVTQRVAYYLEVPVETLDPNRALAAYGFDSVLALTLCGDIEESFGIEVDPTLAWDYPTIGEIATVLRARVEGGLSA